MILAIRVSQRKKYGTFFAVMYSEMSRPTFLGGGDKVLPVDRAWSGDIGDLAPIYRFGGQPPEFHKFPQFPQP